jgi:phenylpropionate dioxygenase-like ring-hydroxylating dioxygenase large terminal subunit
MDAVHAQMVDELGYDPDDGRPALDEIDVPVGAIVAARDGARAVAAARLASGRLVVVDDLCPHDGGRISDGYVDGELLVCARHGWTLLACSGRCERVGGPRSSGFGSPSATVEPAGR